MSFKYKRLPNFCFWCGRLTNGDKDCPLWIQSWGTLKGEDRQVSSSLRAPPYMPSNQKVIFVPRFYDKSGLVDDNRPRKEAQGELVVADSKDTAVQAEENSNMEIEEFGEELMENSNNDGASDTNLETVSIINEAANIMENIYIYIYFIYKIGFYSNLI